LLIFDHDVECGEQFAHAGHGADLIGFACLGESLEEGSDGMVVGSCAEHGHIEDVAQVGSSAPDGAFTAVLAAVLIERCHTDKRRDFLPVEHAKFGQQRQQSASSARADARHAREDLAFVVPVVVGLHECLDLGLDVLDLPVQQVDRLLDVFINAFSASGGSAVIDLHRSHVHELSAAVDQVAEFPLFFRGFLGQTRAAILGETGQHLGVDTIGLGQDVERLGEVANPAGSHHRHLVFPFQQVGDQFLLINSG
jgi:hypothetical protein